MKQNIFKCLLLGIALSVAFTSCREDEFVGDNDLGDGGKTIIKIADGPQKTLFLTAFTDTRKVQLFSVTKDANSNAAISTASTVQLVSAPQLITAYNTANAGANLELLPESIFTLGTPGIVKNATGYAVTFSGGEFNKDFAINIDGSKYDLSKKYAMAFTVGDISNGGVLTAGTQKQILVIVSIKNKWDGVYTVTGTMVDVTNSAFGHYSAFLGATPYRLELRTVTATTCVIWDPKYFNGGGNYVPFYTGTGVSSFGSFDPIIEFNPTTGKIVGITNFYGADVSANIRNARLDPTGVNQFNDATKTMEIKYNLTQKANITPALPAPFIRATFDEKWVYFGSR